MEERNIPKTLNAIENAYNNCKKFNKFKEIDKNLFSDYLTRSQKDIVSAENDFKNEDYYWARIKAYQSLFHMLNALLVKKIGFYSKDHSCILAGLMRNNIITGKVAKELQINTDNLEFLQIPENFIQDIDELRIQRNFALYKPKAWEDVKKENIETELNKIKNNLKILGGLL